MGQRRNLRASDADREVIIERLRKAAAEGRLAAHELEQRVTAALKALTYGELDATVADLPGTVISGRRPAAQRAMSTVRAHPALLLVAIPVTMVVVATLVALTVLWAIAAVIVFVLGHQRHLSRGPWTIATRRPVGPPRRADGRPRGYWA